MSTPPPQPPPQGPEPGPNPYASAAPPPGVPPQQGAPGAGYGYPGQPPVPGPPPGYGYPPGGPGGPAGPGGPGYPGGPVPPYQPQPPQSGKTNGLSVGALVTGLLALAPIALILGILGLNQIKKTGERGKPLAIAGMVLGSVQIALLAVLVPLAIYNNGASIDGAAPSDSASPSGGEDGAQEDPPGRDVPESGERIAVFDIAVGDCFDTSGLDQYQDEEGGSEYDVTLYPCDVPHEAEAFGTHEISGFGAYPGTEELMELANTECNRLVTSYILDTWVLGEDIQIFYYHPEQASWDMGDREILCFFGRGDSRSMSASLRTDEDALSADALRYLEITGPLESTVRLEPADEDLTTNREWAGEMAAAVEDEITELSGATWSEAGVDELIADLISARETSLEHWQAMADASDEQDMWSNYVDGYDTLGVETEIEVRELLGLATGS